jgi:hypothetical protein
LFLRLAGHLRGKGGTNEKLIKELKDAKD